MIQQCICWGCHKILRIDCFVDRVIDMCNIDGCQLQPKNRTSHIAGRSLTQQALDNDPKYHGEWSTAWSCGSTRKQQNELSRLILRQAKGGKSLEISARRSTRMLLSRSIATSDQFKTRCESSLRVNDYIHRRCTLLSILLSHLIWRVQTSPEPPRQHRSWSPYNQLDDNSLSLASRSKPSSRRRSCAIAAHASHVSSRSIDASVVYRIAPRRYEQNGMIFWTLHSTLQLKNSIFQDECIQTVGNFWCQLSMRSYPSEYVIWKSRAIRSYTRMSMPPLACFLSKSTSPICQLPPSYRISYPRPRSAMPQYSCHSHDNDEWTSESFER